MAILIEDNKPIPVSTSSLRTLEYPIRNSDEKNSHYVRFYINVNQDSNVVKNKHVEVTGPVDMTEQNRANRNEMTNSGVLGGIAGGIAGGSVSANILSKIFAGKQGSKATAAGGIVLGGTVGAGLGVASINSLNLTNRLQRLKATITLYTPSQIRASYNMNYSMEQSFLIDLAQQSTADSISKGISAATSSLTGAGSAISDITKIIAATGSTSNNSNLQQLSMATKTAINQKKDIMFRSVANRTFAFDYVFSPRTAIEATAIADIIYTFKYWQHPELLEGFANFLYMYPAEFEIEYGLLNRNTDGTDASTPNKFLNKISSCVLKGIDVNYAPNGSLQSLEQGEPVMTTMTLMFQEIETLHRGRIERGF